MTCVRYVTGPTCKGARTWKGFIDQGRPLPYDDVEQMPTTGCVEYLRAMGETVSRANARDTSTLRQMLQSALSLRHSIGPGQTWTPRLEKQKQKQKRKRAN